VRLGGNAESLGQYLGVGDIGGQPQDPVRGLAGTGDAGHPITLCEELLRDCLPNPPGGTGHDDGTWYRRLGLFVQQHKHTR